MASEGLLGLIIRLGQVLVLKSKDKIIKKSDDEISHSSKTRDFK